MSPSTETEGKAILLYSVGVALYQPSTCNTLIFTEFSVFAYNYLFFIIFKKWFMLITGKLNKNILLSFWVPIWNLGSVINRQTNSLITYL